MLETLPSLNKKKPFMVYSKVNMYLQLFFLCICNHLNVGQNICNCFIVKLLCCHFGQDSLEEEILHLNGIILK